MQVDLLPLNILHYFYHALSDVWAWKLIVGLYLVAA